MTGTSLVDGPLALLWLPHSLTKLKAARNGAICKQLGKHGTAFCFLLKVIVGSVRGPPDLSVAG